MNSIAKALETLGKRIAELENLVAVRDYQIEVLEDEKAELEKKVAENENH